MYEDLFDIDDKNKMRRLAVHDEAAL